MSIAQAPSKYTIPQYVKYRVEVNFTLTDLNGNTTIPNKYYFKLPRFDNRIPDSPMWEETPPYQESELLYHQIRNADPIPFVEQDIFNNTYDIFNATLIAGQNVTLSQRYDIKVNEIVYREIKSTEIGGYDMHDKIFDLYCNNSEVYFNKTDPNLINASNNLTGITPMDNPIEIARKICNWVSSYLTYDNSLSSEMGASWAYENMTGDCSEFTDLMITLLRIQGIPARKVTGILISNKLGIRPSKNQEWLFSYPPNSTSENFLGHAWVEYYVDGAGWIPCDPTWYQISHTYFNRMDYQRLAYNVGAWFSVPLSNDTISEFPIPYYMDSNSTIPQYDSEYQCKIIVLKSHLKSPDIFPYIIMIIPVSVVLIIIVIYRLATASRQIISVPKKKVIEYTKFPQEKGYANSYTPLSEYSTQLTPPLTTYSNQSYGDQSEHTQQIPSYPIGNDQMERLDPSLEQAEQYTPDPQQRDDYQVNSSETNTEKSKQFTSLPQPVNGVNMNASNKNSDQSRTFTPLPKPVKGFKKTKINKNSDQPRTFTPLPKPVKGVKSTPLNENLHQSEKITPLQQPDINSNIEIMNLKRQTDNLNLSLLDKDNKIRQLRGQTSNLEAKIEGYKNWKERLSKEKELLHSKVQQIEQDNIQLQRKISPLSSHVDTLKKDINLKTNYIKQLKEPKAILSSTPVQNLLEEQSPEKIAEISNDTSDPSSIKRNKCPSCGATRRSIKEVIDKNHVISYTPITTYGKKRICKKCGYQF